MTNADKLTIATDALERILHSACMCHLDYGNYQCHCEAYEDAFTALYTIGEAPESND